MLEVPLSTGHAASPAVALGQVAVEGRSLHTEQLAVELLRLGRGSAQPGLEVRLRLLGSCLGGGC